MDVNINTEQKSENIFTYIKMHNSQTIPAKIRKLEKTMIKYSSYTDHLLFSLCSLQQNSIINILAHVLINL